MATAREARTSRYRGLIGQAAMNSTHSYIIGVGAVGRQVAITLATMGFERLMLIDHDSITSANMGTQGWWAGQVGLRKVIAAAAHCQMINPDCKIQVRDGAFRASHVGSLANKHALVFCCVDQMEARREIASATYQDSLFWCDARMTTRNARILCSSPHVGIGDYLDTLIPQSEVVNNEASCTTKSTYFMAANVASVMVGLAVRTLNKDSLLPREVLIDLAVMTMDPIIGEPVLELASDTLLQTVGEVEDGGDGPP